MANLTEEDEWSEGVYQKETSDPVVGGADGVANKAEKSLANRTVYLKNKHEKLKARTAAVIQESGIADLEQPEALFQAISNLIRKSQVGDISWHVGATVPPNKLQMKGQLILRADAPDLWNWIDAQDNNITIVTDGQWNQGLRGVFSFGNGSTNFRLPDPRGLFLRVLDSDKEIDSGRGVGTYQDDEFKEHLHPYQRATDQTGGTGSGIVADNDLYAGEIEDFDTYISAVGGSETRSKNIAWMLCINY